MYKFKFLINCLIVILLISIFNIDLNAGLNNKILIKVEDKVITNYDVKNKIISSLILSDQAINQENINRLKGQTINNLIQIRLKEIEILKHDLNINQSRLNSYFSSVSKGNVQKLEKDFKNNGADFSIFKKEVEIEFKWQKLILTLYSKKIKVDQGPVEAEVKKIFKNKENVEEFNLSEIEILAKDILDEKNLAELKSQIKNFGFGATAFKFSISASASSDGNIGWVNGKSMSKEIYNIVNKMSIGDVSEPIRKQESYIILKLTDKKNSQIGVTDIKDLKEKLIDRQKNELFNLYSRSHLSKIKNISLIEYK